MVVEAKTIFFEKTEKSRQDKFINRLPIFSAAASVTSDNCKPDIESENFSQTDGEDFRHRQSKTTAVIP